jgi:transposase-like protein
MPRSRRPCAPQLKLFGRTYETASFPSTHSRNAADCCGSVHSALERHQGIAESLYYTWSKEFLEAGKRRLAGDAARAATSGEVKDLRREAQELKAVVAEQALETI